MVVTPATTLPATEQPVLYRHAGGHRVRRMAWSALAIAGAGLLASIGAWMLQVQVRGWTDWMPWAALLALLGALGIFVGAVCTFCRRFVVHLEVWPRSHLVLVRTAGVWGESLRLLPWHAFGANATADGPARDPYLRVRLRNGARLILDRASGEAPCGWTTLRAFLQPGTSPASVHELLVPNTSRLPVSLPG